jgi:hypothetical protein
VDAPSLYGGPPFGRYLPEWSKRSPGFNLDRVRTPLWINSLNPRFLLLDWEWFEGLRLLDRPVEMVILNDEQHVLQIPAHRLVSLSGNLDWFDFWLNGHKDPEISKAEQYRRWEDLCDLQKSQTHDYRTFCVGTKH